MNKRGPKPKQLIKIKWSGNFAYALGLLATDGCVFSDGRHISFVSKDLEQVKNFMRCLEIKVIKIGKNIAGHKKGYTYRIQFGDVYFVIFLNKIGITSVKSKTIGKIDIPDKLFFDYLRGEFDGDGSVHSYFDKRWKSSFMFYASFASASINHVTWLQSEIKKFLGISGHITKSKNSSVFQLKYAKADSLKIFKKMYAKRSSISLSRKRLKIKKILAIVGKSSIVR